MRLMGSRGQRPGGQTNPWRLVCIGIATFLHRDSMQKGSKPYANACQGCQDMWTPWQPVCIGMATFLHRIPMQKGSYPYANELPTGKDSPRGTTNLKNVVCALRWQKKTVPSQSKSPPGWVVCIAFA